MATPLPAAFSLAAYVPPGLSAPAEVRTNLQELHQLLLQVQRIVGAPALITSGYRDTATNEAVGGVSGSQHLDGTAADLVFPSLSLAVVAQRLDAAIRRGELAAGQVIYYPMELGGTNRNHVHVSLPTRSSRNRQLIHTAAGTYAALDPATWPAFTRAAVLTVSGLLFAAVVVWLILAETDARA